MPSSDIRDKDSGTRRLRAGLLLLYLLLLACAPAAAPTAALVPTESMRTAAPATLSTNVPTTTAAATLGSTTVPTPAGPEGTAAADVPSPSPRPAAAVEIIGEPGFFDQTERALSLLLDRAPDAHAKVLAHIGVIEQGEHSGMWAFEDPPMLDVNDRTAFHSLTWYAGAIAHDATHSELYHAYVSEYGFPVPEETWAGVEAEAFCNIDEDGDCDWDDYRGRDW